MGVDSDMEVGMESQSDEEVSSPPDPCGDEGRGRARGRAGGRGGRGGRGKSGGGRNGGGRPSRVTVGNFAVSESSVLRVRMARSLRHHNDKMQLLVLVCDV